MNTKKFDVAQDQSWHKLLDSGADTPRFFLMDLADVLNSASRYEEDSVTLSETLAHKISKRLREIAEDI